MVLFFHELFLVCLSFRYAAKSNVYVFYVCLRFILSIEMGKI